MLKASCSEKYSIHRCAFPMRKNKRCFYQKILKDIYVKHMILHPYSAAWEDCGSPFVYLKFKSKKPF